MRVADNLTYNINSVQAIDDPPLLDSVQMLRVIEYRKAKNGGEHESFEYVA